MPQKAAAPRLLRSVLHGASRKTLHLTIVSFVACSLAFVVLTSNSLFYEMPKEERIERLVSEMEMRLQFLQSLYHLRQAEIIDFQMRCFSKENCTDAQLYSVGPTTAPSARVIELLKNFNGTKTASGLYPIHPLDQNAFVYQLLPHLMLDQSSLRPAYHLKGNRNDVNVVIGIPTVRRDKGSYLMTTLSHIIKEMSESELKNTLVIVYVGETDLEFILGVAHDIEINYPQQLESGLIEVLAPSPSYYPNMENITPTLGDSVKRTRWRTKQNLDAIYLMTYAQSKGTFYLMLEDDVVASKNYMKDIQEFTAKKNSESREWFFIEFCDTGGIGKLFRSADLFHFITYLQLFYDKMPIDWLLESYLADRVCSINKSNKECEKKKKEIRPKHGKCLFEHIGLYSSLKGKIQSVKKSKISEVSTYFPHKNPPVVKVYTDIEELSAEHSLRSAYDGKNFFWGLKPKKGNVIEFWFEKPTKLQRYTIRTSNVEHKNDKLLETLVEVLPANGGENFTQVGEFDEFGLADGEIKQDFPALSALRLRVLRGSKYWVLISEIELRAAEVADSIGGR